MALDNPGVRIPPPFFFLAAIFGGLALDRQLWPLRIPSWYGWDVMAAVLIIAFALLVFPSIARFVGSKTTLFPFRASSRLVTTGAYRFSRNPMYLGFALLTVAAGLMLETWWPVLLLPAAIALLQVVVIAREEQYLARRFGQEYIDYCRRVRRWL